MNFTILRYESLDSTNTEAANQARQGADEGLCIIADEQTTGRGRQGRSWVSKKGCGLYFSIILRPKIESKFLPLITLMTGIAVHDLLACYRIEPDIKWVNDILVNEKKICGILAETVETSNGLAVIVGIGINITSQRFPTEIADLATSMDAESDIKFPINIEKLEMELLQFLDFWYEKLNGKNGDETIRNHWQWRSSYFRDKPVRVALSSGTIEGLTDGLEANGALRVKRPDGSITIVQAGDVEHLRSDA